MFFVLIIAAISGFVKSFNSEQDKNNKCNDSFMDNFTEKYYAIYIRK